MNFFNNASTGPKKTVVRKTVQIPVKNVSKPASGRPAPPSRSYQPSVRSGTKATLSGASSRFKPQSAGSSLKRKAFRQATPQQGLSSDDDSSGGEDASDSDFSRKRIKSSVSSVDSGRRISIALDKAKANNGVFGMVQGVDLTTGAQASKFRPPWDEEHVTAVELQYPSHSRRERFELVFPLGNKSDDYKPFEDIIESIKYICLNYFPDARADRYTSDENGFERRLRRAFTRQSVAEFVSTVSEFNDIIATALKDGTIQSVLDNSHTLNLDWIKRILDQTYARTVSPKVETLRAYQNGSDNVYGELLPRFISEIFKETRLREDQLFVDLGSGVGNVVLQAALEVGCESWGCEMMPNPCMLAMLQGKEFPARARLWGLSVGSVNLLNADFRSNNQLDNILKRADVVLVNNQAFGPQLNNELLLKFFDLKDGCQVVSLKSFVPESHVMSERNLEDPVNMLEVTKKEYFSNSVSWTDQGGSYFIARKEPQRIKEFQKSLERSRRR